MALNETLTVRNTSTHAFTLHAHDPDNTDILTYSVKPEQVNLDGKFVFIVSQIGDVQFRLLDGTICNGTYTVPWEASDGYLTASATIIITIDRNNGTRSIDVVILILMTKMSAARLLPPLGVRQITQQLLLLVRS